MNRQVKNLQGIGNFFPGFQSRPLDPKDFCMEATGTPLQRVGFPGANKQADDSPVVTRRFILSRVSVMYDPLGLILPVVLKGRSIFQSATRRQLSWDDPVPDDLSNEWNSWQRSLCDLEHLSFPRCIIPAEYENGMFELHHFCDASTTGYGASSYLRVVSPTGGISVSLVASKARLAPIKVVIIPRLELAAAVIAVRLDNLIKSVLEIECVVSTFWSDNQIVLAYLQSESVIQFTRAMALHKQSWESGWHTFPWLWCISVASRWARVPL